MYRLYLKFHIILLKFFLILIDFNRNILKCGIYIGLNNLLGTKSNKNYLGTKN